MTEEPVRALVAVVDGVEEKVEERVEERVERRKDKPPKRDKRFRSPAPDDNRPIAPVGFAVTPSAEQPPAADDEQGDEDDQGRIDGSPPRGRGSGHNRGAAAACANMPLCLASAPPVRSASPTARSTSGAGYRPRSAGR